MKTATEISVQRRVRDGWFVYTCNELPGLYVAGKDDRAAYDDLPVAIEELFRLDFGAVVTAFPKLTYDRFLATLSDRSDADRAVIDRTADLMADGGDMYHFVVGQGETRRPA